MTEKVRVAARIRPLPSSDISLAVAPLDERRICVGNRRVYQFDRVFGIEDSNEFIFFESVVSLIDRFLAGYNATVLAYGQTGTGKTFTMAGLTPLVLRYIVESMNNSTSQLSFQCVEVYGEALRDLLTNDPVGSAKHLQLHDGNNNNNENNNNNNNGTVVVVGAARVKARSIEEVQEIIDHGARMRATGATNINEHSSRSHSIFTIFNHARGSKLNLVDLAGSERNKKTQNVGQRFRESIAINGGLLALGNVIRALSRNHFQCPDNPRHVPYRSSKLTRLLQDSLGGNSTTLLIACVAADSGNIDETTRTLQYSALAMNILNEPLPQFDEQVAAASRKEGNNNNNTNERYENLSSSSLAIEVGELRQQVAMLESQLLRCREELKNDEGVFAQQIEDMRLLLEENESLKQRVAFLEGRPNNFNSTPLNSPRNAINVNNAILQLQKQQQQQWNPEPIPPNPNYIRDSLQIHGITTQQNSKEGLISQFSIRPPSIGSVGGAAMETDRNYNQQQQQQNYLSKKAYTSVGWSEAVVAAAAAAPTTTYGAKAINNNNKSEIWGEAERAAAAAREEQLSLLAKEALYYQSSNSELRQRLRTVLSLYEAQQREAAMLRLEVKQIHDLLDGAPHV